MPGNPPPASVRSPSIVVAPVGQSIRIPAPPPIVARMPPALAIRADDTRMGPLGPPARQADTAASPSRSRTAAAAARAAAIAIGATGVPAAADPASASA